MIRKSLAVKIYLLLFVHFCVISYIYANPDYYFKQISLQDGLTQSSVRCVLNDHKGFIWIGTKSGLNRYDRHELKAYFNDIDNKNSLPDNQINFIAEDSIHNIWISTERGLALYNQDQDDFTRIIHDNKPLNARSFLPQKDGILFGSNGKLYKYFFRNREIKEILYSSNEKVTAYFNYLGQWKDGLIIAGSRWNGFWIYNPQTNELKRPDFYSEKQIISLFVDSKQNIWISPYGKGVLCFSKDGELIHNYTTANSRLSNNIILDIEEKNGNIWFATDGGGISILNVKKQNFTVIEHIPGNVYSLPVNSIYCLYKDNEDNMWAGSIRGGLFGIREAFIKTYKDVALENPYGLSERTVLSLYEDQGKIWIGTDGGGVNNFTPGNDHFRHYPSTYKDKVASITGYNDDELLISVFGKGIYSFNTKTGKKRPFILINEQENDRICRSGAAVNLNKFAKNKIHIFADSIYVYDLENKQFTTVIFSGNKYDVISSLVPITSNEYVTYLLGQRNLFELNNRQNTLKTIFTLPDRSVVTTAACRDYQGKIWIGTTKGLLCFDPQSGQARKIETKLFHNVSSLICDKKGRLWIGAQDMLFAYIINENRFAVFGESDGAYPNEFLNKPVLLSQNGDIYMGGITGLMRIGNNIETEGSSQPNIELIDVTLNGISVTSQIDSEDRSLSIPWNHTSLMIKIMAIEQDVFRKKMFRYNVIGLNKYYIETYDHTLTLHSLPAGNYEIMVSCNAKDGSWSFPFKVLSVSVTPPWWKSKWFIAILAIAALGAVILASVFVIRRKENKLKWEMKEHEQKTYEEKVRFLINISHELRTPLTLIYAPLKRLLSTNIADENTKKQLTGIYKQAKQMKNIINMVLDARKMEVGQDKLHLQPHLLNEWLHSIAEDFKNEFEAKNIRLVYDFDESVHEVSFDEGKCEIVISNLLMNALKFSNNDSTITLSTRINGDMVRVSVIDEGIGLEGTDTSKLFTRFYQGNHDRKGSGIGLSYAKTLVEMHQGTIGAKNNMEKGATFYYELPLASVNENISCEEKPYLNELLYSPKEETPTIKSFSTKDYSILIVEDEPELRNFLQETYSELFKTVYAAENGVEALAIIHQYFPDIVVSDVMMPKMDGFELCKRIKETIDISHIPVILLTARGDSESTSLGYKLGADAYLSKPFDTDFLHTLMVNQLKNREFIKSRYKNSEMILPPEEVTFSNADEQFLLKLNAIIHEKIADPALDVKFLTDKMGMSRASLYNKMKQLTDMGVNDYINKFRIEKAARLLTQTDLSITEVSEMAGFSNQRYFSTVFKQATGSSPTKYKEEKRNPPSL